MFPQTNLQHDIMNKRKTSELQKHTVIKNAVIAGSDYDQFLSDLKSRIQTARLSAARAVNRDLVLLYWDIGRAIVEKQQVLGWGESVVELVSADLQKAFPGMRGFSANNLWLMRQFFSEYSAAGFLEHLVQEMEKGKRRYLELPVPGLEPPNRSSKSTKPWSILEQLVQELLPAVPWGHHIEIVKKVKAPAARLYYLRATARFGWSRNVLLNQIKAGAYERAVTEKKTHNFPLALPEYLAEQAEETMKSSYNLEFLGIRREVRERQLEDRLLERLREFILELGYGFLLCGPPTPPRVGAERVLHRPALLPPVY
jgi:predicted nuclease of restriction endonuclease-like (RecB) superfamily